MEISLKDIKTEVVDFYEKLSKYCLHEKVDVFYKIFLSPFYQETKILFIGINPGAGENIKCVEEADKFEYLQHDFKLAKETRDVFAIAKKSYLLNENIVKTNFYYLVTKSENDIYSFTDNLPKNLRDEFYSNAYKWTYCMFKLTNPKMIICEGKTAYKNVYDCLKLEFEEEKKYVGIFVTTFKNSDVILIGYSRRYSNIRNKTKLAELINEYL